MIQAKYLPGMENIAADWESRHHNDSSNWQLSPTVFNAVTELLGPFSIDLFTSRISHQLPTYCSWKLDPGAISVDAFSISWRDKSPYLFPPFCLIGRALLKIQRESVEQTCLIAPAWPGQVWYSQLLTMLTDYPILLPQYPELLLSPDQKPHPLFAQEEVIPDCVACLRQSYEVQGFSRRVAELLIQSWRNATNSSYNSAWHKWHRWCAGRNCNPTSTPISNILQFLAEQFDTGLQFCSVNALRSAISTMHTSIDGMTVGRHPLVSRLLKAGMFDVHPITTLLSFMGCASSSQLFKSLQIRVVVNSLSHYKSVNLTTLQLAKKTVTLLALVNADRCSDLAALDREHVQWTASGVEFTVVHLTNTLFTLQ